MIGFGLLDVVTGAPSHSFDASISPEMVFVALMLRPRSSLNFFAGL
jgi:hypothetical protein